jgi:hypothetical protein
MIAMVFLQSIQLGMTIWILFWIYRKKSKTVGDIIKAQPHSLFKKQKRKPVANDDERAYELEQKERKGPQPT